MYQEKKLEEQARLEEYLEENHVFEIFEDMMKSLILKRPDDPIKFLLEKIKSPPGKDELTVSNSSALHNSWTSWL
jgi:adenylate kinase